MKRASDEEFIRTWQAAESVQEVADATKYGYWSCVARASLLRTSGIPLKRMGRNIAIDVERLKKIAIDEYVKSLK